MQELMYHTSVHRKNTSNWVGVLAVIPILCLVVIIVNFFIGEDKLPAPFKGSNIYLIITMIISAIGVIILYQKSKINLEIYKAGNKISIEIQDKKEIDTIRIESPFTMIRQWHHIETGQRVKMKKIILTFIDKNNEKAFSITGSLGAIHDAPAEWEYLNLFNEEDRKRLVLSENEYTTGDTENIFHEVNILQAMH